MDSCIGVAMTNNTDCNTLILSFRTGYPVTNEITETIMDTPSRVSNQGNNSLVKHAVIRREVKPQSTHKLVNSVKSGESDIDFDDLDEEEDLHGNNNHAMLQQTDRHYFYKCGKLGPYESLLQILR